MNRAVVIDVMNAAYRAHYSVGKANLSNGVSDTGVLFGIYKLSQQLAYLYQTTNLVYCFDSRYPLRKQLDPAYKATRHKDKSPEQLAELQTVHEQVAKLGPLVTKLGLQAFGVKGYEADDLIASIAQSNKDWDVTIVSSDEDLWQCLEGLRVVCHRPSNTNKLVYTQEDLWNEYGVMPCQWGSVKAWAGCSSDNITGLKGVGNKTAAKFIQGKFKTPEKFTDNIETYNHNVKLTRLPYKGCPAIKLINNESAIPWHIYADAIGSVEGVSFWQS